MLILLNASAFLISFFFFFFFFFYFPFFLKGSFSSILKNDIQGDVHKEKHLKWKKEHPSVFFS